MSERILITGASGLVGKYVLPILKDDYSVYATTHLANTGTHQTIQIDLTCKNAVEELLNRVKPDIILNLASLTDVEKCETQRELAKHINADLVSIFAEYLHSNEAFLLHISTDYIFNGEKGNYKETDEPSPVNWYGETKLIAEKEIILKVPEDRWCIARTSSVFGFHKQKQTFPLYVIDKLKKGDKVNAIEDQYTNPTYAADLAKMIQEIIDMRICGIIHLTGSSKLSRYKQAEIITEVFDFDNRLVQGIKLKDMNYKAHRPRDSSLNVTKATEILSNVPRSFASALRLFKDELSKENYIQDSN